MMSLRKGRLVVFYSLLVVLLAGSLVFAQACRGAIIGPVAKVAEKSPSTRAVGKLTVTVFDLLTHGLAVAVETPAGDMWLVDTGERANWRDRPDYYGARDTIAPFLAAKRITTLSGLVLSHPHGDHFGGAPYILDHFKIKQLVDCGFDQFWGKEVDEYRKIVQKFVEKGVKHVVVAAGAKLPWDPALSVEALSPPEGFIKIEKTPGRLELAGFNDNSLVLRIQHGKNVILLPGDAGRRAQMDMISSYGADKLRATVMVSPHHGFDSYREFAAAVRPEVVIVSCLALYSNGGNPGQKATEVFGSAGAKVYVTPWDGTVRVTSDGERYVVETSRMRRASANVPLVAPVTSINRNRAEVVPIWGDASSLNVPKQLIYAEVN